ncbi:hypothetical protein [Subtercola endophyticus]|uniref:hypothetical protein n=1 Tax=Subtercola endophyticus TaxID=2895559 RepID=UPI001E3CBB21|nr:hypothetical protein [Subtercola endophyticus]UFS60407.1 hypothetical protein LQ955_06580 [Subtercola endophyticus]
MNIQRQGRWLYGAATYLPVDIVSLNYDFWYELAKADHQLEPDEHPTPLNAEGVLYYYRYRQAAKPSASVCPDSIGYTEIEDAMKAAEERSPSPIQWD